MLPAAAPGMYATRVVKILYTPKDYKLATIEFYSRT